MRGAKVPVLNRRLVLEAPVETPDGAGGLVVSWQERGTLWAEVRARSGRAVRLGAGTGAHLGLEISVRGAPQGAATRPVPGQRFREGGRTYAILAVAERDREGRFLSCYAEEEVPA